MVRVKFTVVSVEPSQNVSDGERSTIKLIPVTSGSPENEEFYRFTPSGSIELSTINDAAAEEFVVGKEYYVDFSPAEAQG